MPQLWPSKPTVDHPTVYWLEMEGVSRVHLPDQFVWGDWADHETLAVLEIFLEEVEAAAAGLCSGSGDGEIERAFDEKYDVQWRKKDFQDRLKRQAGECWKSGVGTPKSTKKPAATAPKSAEKAKAAPVPSPPTAPSPAGPAPAPQPAPAPSPAQPAGRRRKRAAKAESAMPLDSPVGSGNRASAPGEIKELHVDNPVVAGTDGQMIMRKFSIKQGSSGSY